MCACTWSCGTPRPVSYMTEVVLRLAESLVRRQPKPPHRLGTVLRDAYAVAVHDPEVGLRVGVSLIRRQPKPPRRFGVVLRDTFAVGVHGPEVELRLSITCLRTRPQRIDLRRLRLHRRTDGERDQDGDGGEPGGVRHASLLAQSDVMSNPILLLAGRNRYEKQRVASSPVPDTARQSTHRRTPYVP